MKDYYFIDDSPTPFEKGGQESCIRRFFIILAEKGVVTLKCITKPNIDDYNNLIAKTRKAVKVAGFTKDALKKIIKDVRKK